MKLGKGILGRRHVNPSVVGTLKQMQVEGTFETGTHLITIHNPISTDDGDLKMALYGSFLPMPAQDLFPAIKEADFHPLSMLGAVHPAESEGIVLNEGRARVRLTVTNKGTRAVHVSHATRSRYRSMILICIFRSAPTSISWKRTRISTSTAKRLTDTASMYQLGSFCALNPMSRRLSPSFKLEAQRSYRAEAATPKGRSLPPTPRRSCKNCSKLDTDIRWRNQRSKR